jgi:hypothetical protein
MFNVSKELGEKEVENCYRSYIVTKATTSYIANSVIGCIVNLLLCFVGTFLNALVVYVFWKTPKLRYRVSYFMIMVLSSIDILVTLIVHPAHLVMSIAEIVGKPRCVYKAFYHVAAIVLPGASFLTFFVMNIERYLSIVHPIFHLKHVTKLRCLIVCSVLWSLAIFCGPVAYPLHLNVQFVLTIVALIIMLGTCYIYLAIFYIARKRRRRLRLNVRRVEDRKIFLVEESCTHTDNTGSDNAPDKPSHMGIEERNSETLNIQNSLSTINNQKTLKHDKTREKSNKTISFLHDLQLAKMYLLVVFSSFVLNLPNAIVLAVFHDRINTLNGLVQSKIWTVTLVLMNSTVNSLIFFWANEGLRVEGWNVCKRFFTR